MIILCLKQPFNIPLTSDVTQHIALNFPCSKKKHWRK